MRTESLWIFFIISLILGPFVLNIIGVTTALGTHDIAVTSVTPSPTSVRLGELVNITVIVENRGTENETFDVTVYYDTTNIETRTSIILEAGLNTSLTFTWNTTDVREEIYATDEKGKTYIINATASTVAGETLEDQEDNTLVSSSTVKVISHYIEVVPQSTVDPNLTPGLNYTVSIYTDYNGTDIWGYEFTLTYNPNVLQGVEVTNGDLITTATAPIMFHSNGFDNTLGELKRTGSGFSFFEPPPPLASGPGTLANVTFTIVGAGDSDITLGTTAFATSRLIGRNATTGGEYNIIDDITPYLDHILHGYFGISEVVIHDVAVISVTLNTTSVVAGELVNITVGVKNNGTVTETFDVKVYYDQIAPNWLIETQTVQNLGAGANTSLTFTWNTTDVGEGDKTVIAKAIPVLGEENTTNNTLESDKKVTVNFPPEPPLPIELIIGVLVVVIVVIAVATYVTKRRKKPTLE